MTRKSSTKPTVTWTPCQRYQRCGCGATARPADHCVCGVPKSAHWIEPEKTTGERTDPA